MLYKYAPYDRRDILENGLIRFTQPGAFNDPFELHPSFDLMSKTDIARLPEAPGQEGQSGPKARLLTPEVMQAMMSALMQVSNEPLQPLFKAKAFSRSTTIKSRGRCSTPSSGNTLAS